MKKIAWPLMLALCCGLALAAVLIIQAFSEHMHVFYTPSQLTEKRQSHPMLPALRLGGMVEPGSVHVEEGPEPRIVFVVTDFVDRYSVRYSGILPDLFKEGAGVIAEGRLGSDLVFEAKRILAKHDERYEPPELQNIHPPKGKGDRK